MSPGDPPPPFSTLDLIRRYGSLRVNNEVVPNDRNRAAVEDMVALLELRLNTDRAEAYAEGRRQATEGWEREWGVAHGPGRIPDRGDDEITARRLASYRPDRRILSRLVGPWEPAEQPACPTCSGPIRETVGMVCQTCGKDYAPAEQPEDGTR